MDLSNPERAIIPSLEGPLLRVLAGTSAPLSLTRVSRLANVGSISGTRKALLRLAAQGVVSHVPGGYILNRNHLATPAVTLLAGMRTELLLRIREHAQSWPDPPLLLAAFGSFARREGDADSDIDLLMITRAVDSSERASELAERVRAWTGNDCHVIALRPVDLDRMRQNKERILAEWDRDLEVIEGDPRLIKGSM